MITVIMMLKALLSGGIPIEAIVIFGILDSITLITGYLMGKEKIEEKK